MQKFLLIVFIVAIAACNGTSTVEREADTLGKNIDTLLNKVENSETMDSIKSKGGRLLDSAKSKGGLLLNKAEDKFKDLKKKDSAN